jgi:hypothetical protein
MQIGVLVSLEPSLHSTRTAYQWEFGSGGENVLPVDPEGAVVRTSRAGTEPPHDEDSLAITE